MRGLGDCRDLSWSADGARLAAAGKEANALSLLEAAAPGCCFALSSLGGSAEPALIGPSLLRLLPCGSILALSESSGAAYAALLPASQPGLPRLAGSLALPCLAGAKDLAVSANASCAYVAASGADAVARISLGPSGELLGAASAIAKGAPGLETFAKPYCLALSPDGSLLAVGTAGDDAIYLFDRDGTTEALSLRSRLDKAAFPAGGPLSDPCSLAFSPGGASLFVLSYYGKAVIRLDRDASTGLYAPAASARSGQSGVAGFAYPKRLALSPGGEYLALIGSGADDGLALFRVGSVAQLEFIGALLPAAGLALPKKPSALAFSPDGAKLAIAADGLLSIFAVGPH
jgi:DNA-binding beta-propeller fold protein YncE